MARLKSALFCAAMIGGLGSVVGAAQAADDGYQNVVVSVLGAVGLWKTDGSPEIDYRERAPLVLPPKTALQKPVDPGSARTASWPQDPDVLKRRKAEAEARAPSILSFGSHTEQVSREELMKGSAPGTTNVALRDSRCTNTGNQRGCLLIDPDELRRENEHYLASGFGDGPKKELAAGEEPDRVYLTQPPKGYLKTSKTVKATAEPPVIRRDEASPLSGLVYRAKPEE